MATDLKFYVFRDGRKTVPAEHLLGALRGSLRAAKDENGWVDALLRSGELECALDDAGDAQAREIAAITDTCAKKLVSWSYSARPELMTELPLRLAGEVQVSTPEGFAYYALHPRQYADVVERLGALRGAVVVGIRSIGTTLSAVMGAALSGRGSWVKRMTVRPEGHPFDREVKWNVTHLQAICAGIIRNATFVIVDEGPGLSGSSFLSVAEALLKAGVEADKIVLVPSHEVNVAGLRAKDAAARWKRFRCVTVGDGRYPEGEWIGGGEWRKLLGERGEGVGAWKTLERAKFLAPEVFWKFAGHGAYGAQMRATARSLADAGFAPKIVGDKSGYIGYEFVAGRHASSADLNTERLRTMVAYCAFRSEEFACAASDAQQKDLATMVRVNYEREFGTRLPAALRKLPVVRTMICDAKMAPHEWMLAADGRFLKLDGDSHGDDHFFPGPCDVAWDLVGAMVEWDMDASTREAFAREYVAQTHDNVAPRIRNYVVAYAVFRMAWARTAAAGMRGTAEEERLTREALRHRGFVERAVKGASAAVQEAIAS